MTFLRIVTDDNAKYIEKTITEIIQKRLEKLDHPNTKSSVDELLSWIPQLFQGLPKGYDHTGQIDDKKEEDTLKSATNNDDNINDTKYDNTLLLLAVEYLLHVPIRALFNKEDEEKNMGTQKRDVEAKFKVLKDLAIQAKP